MSYTAQLLKQQGIKILDEVGSNIGSFSKIMNETNYNIYKPKTPSILIDKFAQKKTIAGRRTELVRTYDDLKRMGYIVISQRINPFKAWFKRQRVFYKLCPLHSKPFNAVTYSGFPAKHHVKHDFINKMLRLIGPLSSKEQGWVPILDLEK